MSAKIFAAIALGGALGAMARYAAVNWALRIFGSDFPHGTMIVNVVGCLLMGVLIETMVEGWNPGAELRAMLVVGMLGALTTFSSFALDFYGLTGRGEITTAILYAGLSVVLSLGAMFTGVHLVRLAARIF